MAELQWKIDPEVEVRQRPARRRCLACLEFFQSAGPQNRLCPRCKRVERKDYLQG